MKQVMIVDPGATFVFASEPGEEVAAYVPSLHALHDAQLVAEVLGLPYFKEDRALRVSPQSVRVVPTLRAIMRLGSGVYGSLPQTTVDVMNWPGMRGVQTELLTAYLVAKALQATCICWHFSARSGLPQVPPSVMSCLVRNGVRLVFKPCR